MTVYAINFMWKVYKLCLVIYVIISYITYFIIINIDYEYTYISFFLINSRIMRIP